MMQFNVISKTLVFDRIVLVADDWEKLFLLIEIWDVPIFHLPIDQVHSK